MIQPDDETVAAIQQAIETARKNKPNDRSEADRAYAVVITELEKALAYAKTFIQNS
jgi:hypothetical protein